MLKKTSTYELYHIEINEELHLVESIGKSVSQIGKDMKPIYRQNAQFANRDVNGTYYPIGHTIKNGVLKKYHKELKWSAFVITESGIPYIARGDISTVTNAKLAFYGTPQILRNGEVSINHLAEGTATDIWQGSNYRSVIVTNNKGQIALLRTLITMTLIQVAQLLKDLGYYNALNLDGGGSVSGGSGDYKPLVYERPISNALVVTAKPPEILYRVQVGAYGVKANAEKMATELKGKGYSTIIVEGVR